jgi:hypothetical protein
MELMDGEVKVAVVEDANTALGLVGALIERYSADVLDDVTGRFQADSLQAILKVWLPGCAVVTVECDGRHGGCFVFEPKADGEMEVHTMLQENCRGRRGIQAGLRAIELMFRRPEVRKLTSYCPMNRPEIGLFARRCGFRRVKLIPRAWRKDGLWDLEQVELSRVKMKE